MRRLGSGLLLACLLAGQAAGEESPAEAMKAFGLLGSWSLNCSIPMTVCDKKGCGSRNIYEVWPSGQSRSRTVNGSTVSGRGTSFEADIQSATRIADDKLKIISTQLQPQGMTMPTLPWLRQPGERWEVVLIKSGNKYRTLSARREDGGKVAVEDGFAVRPPPDTKPDQLPTSWIRTTQEAPWFEKCMDVVIRSDDSGYAVTFPAAVQPTEDVKDTPVGKLIIHLALDGDSMFMASEAVTPLSDVSSGLESSVTGFVSSFKGAVVTSRQNAGFTGVSGTALPAIKFTFAGRDANFTLERRDIFGEGVVVASGRYLITIAAADMNEASANPGGKRFAIEKFVSSLKIEK
jgi:hypothetical protein